MRPRRKYWAERAVAVRERLDEAVHWFPYPMLISFALVLIFTGHVLFGTNPRAGNPANIISFPSETRKDSAIWLSVTPIGDEIVVTTADRKVFRWRREVRSLSELKSFSAYLKGRVADEVQGAAMAKHALASQVSAVIAADQRLKYLHVRPIIYALAEAGISQYAFETQNPMVSVAPAHKAEAAGDEHL